LYTKKQVFENFTKIIHCFLGGAPPPGCPSGYVTVFIDEAVTSALLPVLQVTWYVPVVDGPGCRSRRPNLTKVTRLQRFLTYLVIHSDNLSSRSALFESHCLHTLKAVSWSVKITINVDPTKPVGERVTFIGPLRQRDPEIIDGTSAPSLSENALQPPNANSSQTLIWWPANANEEPVVVVKPLTTTPSIAKAAQSYQHSQSRHALRLRSLYHFSVPR